MCVGDAMRYKKAISRIENDVDNEEIQSVSDPSRRAMFYCFDVLLIAAPLASTRKRHNKNSLR